MTNSINEIEDAACLFIIGSNTTEAHPLIAHRVFKAHDKGAKIIIVDPRRIQLSLIADIHVRPNFGTDVALINGIMHEIIAKGLHDREFIAQRTEGFAELEAMLGHFSP